LPDLRGISPMLILRRLVNIKRATHVLYYPA
jgi:hypothetical protein